MTEIFGYSLDELLDFSVVARLQQIFSSLTGLVAHVVDLEGNQLAEDAKGTKNNSEHYCSEFIRNNNIGDRMCRYCEISTALENMKREGASVNYCHAGLVQFSYPVVVRGQVACIFTGGRALIKPLTPQMIKETAALLNIDEQELWLAAEKIPVYSSEHMRLAAEELHMLAGVLSDMAETKLKNLETEASLKRADSVKSDFLANMSHEIRTPMNAVIGMSELALREEMKDDVRNYIHQINSSGKALLAIINDILDYSKIESGKMEIVEDDYEPMSVINDVTTIIMSRILEKDNVELLLNVSPDVPRVLHGDSLRIRQVLINIANNAVKFTNQGHVIIRCFTRITADPKVVNLVFEVVDTGIGIKQEDIPKLFGSFQQVDSKRNRNVEGSGLGLSIVKRLLSLMGGEIKVDSEYNVGSTFSFSIPQTIVDANPSITVNEPEKKYIAVLTDSDVVSGGMAHTAATLKLKASFYNQNKSVSEVFALVRKNGSDREKYLYIDERIFDLRVDEIEELRNGEYKDINVVVMAEARTDVHKWDNFERLRVLKKPIYVLNVVAMLHHQQLNFTENNEGTDVVDFEAPDARVLLVDDNSVNLMVSAGLLEPLHMKVDTATSGKQTLEMIGNTQYDIIFMDHMMPEMDGIETTRIIRRMYQTYSSTPIIALTANAVSGAKEMFLEEGMNDFISKPIELKTLIAKVKQWLPADKIKSSIMTKTDGEVMSNGVPDLNNLKIGDLQIDKAKTALGSDKLYWDILREYYRQIEKKAEAIQASFEAEDWPNYIIEVHALKSSSRQIGAMDVGALAAQMEIAGNERNISLIQKETGKLLSKYKSLIAMLAPYFVEEEKKSDDLEFADANTIRQMMTNLRQAMDELNMTDIEKFGAEFANYQYDDLQTEYATRLQQAVSGLDVDECEAILKEWEDLL